MVEICCGGFEDARKAYEAGAKRIELNCALELGGITPSLGSLLMTKQHTNLEVMTMIRPRSGDFCYNPYEYEQMVEDANLFLSYGTDGLVFGFLLEDGTLDEIRTKEFVELAHGEGKTAVFHRAFDEVAEPIKTLDQLVQLGVDRVLTSGQEETAEQGIPLLKEIQQSHGSRIEILPGAGINKDNKNIIMEKTGITQIHGSRLELLL